MNIVIQPSLLNDLKNELEYQEKNVVRFELVNFG